MKRQHVLGVIALFLLLAIDQGSKYLAVHFLQGHPDVMLIPGVFQLEYLENRGAEMTIGKAATTFSNIPTTEDTIIPKKSRMISHGILFFMLCSVVSFRSSSAVSPASFA